MGGYNNGVGGGEGVGIGVDEYNRLMVTLSV